MCPRDLGFYDTATNATKIATTNMLKYCNRLKLNMHTRNYVAVYVVLSAESFRRHLSEIEWK